MWMLSWINFIVTFTRGILIILLLTRYKVTFTRGILIILLLIRYKVTFTRGILIILLLIRYKVTFTRGILIILLLIRYKKIKMWASCLFWIHCCFWRVTFSGLVNCSSNKIWLNKQKLHPSNKLLVWVYHRH
jgi:hypothetical protein